MSSDPSLSRAEEALDAEATSARRDPQRIDRPEASAGWPDRWDWEEDNLADGEGVGPFPARRKPPAAPIPRAAGLSPLRTRGTRGKAAISSGRGRGEHRAFLGSLQQPGKSSTANRPAAAVRAPAVVLSRTRSLVPHGSHDMTKLELHRRGFLVAGGATLLGCAANGKTPSLARSGYKSPNEKLDVAAIGAGGKGAVDIGACAGENIVALCDVDWKSAAETFDRFPRARRYKDFRQMLDREKHRRGHRSRTPDHTHAPAAMMAMQRGQARLLREAARPTPSGRRGS